MPTSAGVRAPADRMYLNPQQIMFVEPVSANSKVAQLIAEAPQK
jgi:hypothetical protein